jgi:superfamily II DNA or RNA helicase/very-short-patch-repair endonuclease
MGAFILTETMEQRPDVGLDSYDRFFPNQDTLPKGGFGNLIALPLQKGPREHGNSVFVDDTFTVYPDQWAFLSSIRRILRNEIEGLVRTAERKGRVIGVDFPDDEELDHTPWTAPPSRRRKDTPIPGPLPKTLELTMGNEIYIAKADLAPGFRNRLLRIAAFQNPEFYKAQAMRLPTYGKARVIACAEDFPLHIGLPRGCLESIQALLANLKIKPVLKDERFSGTTLGTTFLGVLRPEQEAAVNAMAVFETGVLSATTAFGKTVVAAKLIALRNVNTLVLVHRQQLMEQWVERLASFLDIPRKEIGRIGGGHKNANGKLDVALIQSMVRKGVVNDLVGDYGHLIVDECHHLPASSFEQVARRSKAKFVLGLSATVTRKDGHHPIITMQCGPIRYRVDARKQAKARPFSHSVVVHPTAFRAPEVNEQDQRMQFKKLVDYMVRDEVRNRLICEDVVKAVKDGRSPIVLTERTDHLSKLEEALASKCEHLIVLKGGMGKKKLSAALTALSAIPDDEERLLLATGKFIGEGFDDARLDTLFLTLPVSWRGTIAQYAGRLHRLHDRKNEVRIYDYADLNEPMLARMFDRRCKGYEAIGYTIQLPASAVPGWPVDVPLPIDPTWKRDYAASIQRLIRDGVDTPLADLFVYTAHSIEADAQGEDRARSATEKFLYRRLETIPETAGKFRLNAVLPIPFDGSGSMEVDLLFAEAKVAIEVDGPHHLTDSEAYRRDRRKDLMLQEHGYCVVRFLAEDVGKYLDHVLDTVLRVLATYNRQNKSDSVC